MKIKKLLTKSVIAWGITSALLVVLLSVGNILARGTYSSLLDQVFDKKEAIVSEEDTGIVFEQDFLQKKRL